MLAVELKAIRRRLGLEWSDRFVNRIRSASGRGLAIYLCRCETSAPGPDHGVDAAGKFGYWDTERDSASVVENLDRTFLAHSSDNSAPTRIFSSHGPWVVDVGYTIHADRIGRTPDRPRAGPAPLVEVSRGADRVDAFPIAGRRQR